MRVWRRTDDGVLEEEPEVCEWCRNCESVERRMTAPDSAGEASETAAVEGHDDLIVLQD